MKKAVVVDDENMILMILSAFLNERLGFSKTFTFLNAKEALEFIKSNGKEIDLLISDNKMPGMSGLVFIKKVKEIFPDIRIIYMSGEGEDEEIIVRYDKFLLKPFEFEELKEAVEGLPFC